MLRIVVTICAVSQLATALPQRQLSGAPGASGPRPVAQSGGPNNQPAASSLGQFSPAFQQQLNFGAAPPAVRGRGPATYQAPGLGIIPGPSASPATPSFAALAGAGAFGGAGRQILTLRSPAQADDDEYEYEDDDEPTLHGRPAPRPAIPVTRTPVRVASPVQSALGLGIAAGAGRFNAAPVQQPIRQRQPIPSIGAIAAQPLQPIRAAPRPDVGPQFGIDGKRSRLTTPAPIQTVNRYQRTNDDGSVTWGYENEDGTFKEETLGADCVVRGKYGYVDPEGNKREYEYQTGNPCDPNKKDQEEVEEEEDLPDGPSRPQQLAGVLNARPRPVQRRPIAQQGGGAHLGQLGQIPHYQQQPQYAIS